MEKNTSDQKRSKDDVVRSVGDSGRWAVKTVKGKCRKLIKIKKRTVERNKASRIVGCEIIQEVFWNRKISRTVNIFKISHDADKVATLAPFCPGVQKNATYHFKHPTENRLWTHLARWQTRARINCRMNACRVGARRSNREKPHRFRPAAGWFLPKAAHFGRNCWSLGCWQMVVNNWPRSLSSRRYSRFSQRHEPVLY